MRKTLLGLGILVLFGGILAFSVANLPSPPERVYETIGDREIDLPYGDWKIERTLNQSQHVFVAFRGPNLGDEGPLPDAPQLWFNITDPNGGNTTLRADFRREIGICLHVRATLFIGH